MEPPEAWCPVCYATVNPQALRCRDCGAYFRGRYGCEPITTPPGSVSYGNPGPQRDEEGRLVLTGISLVFHPPRITDGAR